MNNPIPNQTKLQRITSWIKTHKKLILVVIAVVFLFVVLGLTVFQVFKSKLFPAKNPSQQTGQNIDQKPNQSSMEIQTTKDTFSLNEKITIRVAASSAGEAIRAFDTLIEYDPEFLSLTNKKSPTQDKFQYYGSNTGRLIQLSAVQKQDITQDQTFDNTPLFEFEFTPKKKGKTTLKIIYAPNATNESNLINKESKDILGSARGKEITIE